MSKFRAGVPAMYMSSDLAGIPLEFRWWPDFCWGRSFLPGFQGVDLVSADDVLAFDRIEGFHQRCGLGCGVEKRKVNWSYAGQILVVWETVLPGTVCWPGLWGVEGFF